MGLWVGILRLTLGKIVLGLRMLGGCVMAFGGMSNEFEKDAHLHICKLQVVFIQP